MKFDTRRCLSCGTPGDPYLRIAGTDFWFCGSACIERESDKYMDKDLTRDKDWFTDGYGKKLWAEVSAKMQEGGHTTFQFCPELEAELKPYRNSWYRAQKKAIERAEEKLNERIRAEWAHQQAEKAEKQRKLDDEEWERQQAEQDRREMLAPKDIPEETRFSGTWIISPPGRGKTKLLQRMVVEAINKEGTVVLMDAKGDLIDAFRNLKDYKDYLIIIDPLNPIAINPLDVPKTNITQSVDFLEYLFGALLEFKMTPMQQTLFRSVFRAMVTAFPKPNLSTFRDLLVSGIGKYKQYIDTLDDELKDFFYNDFDKIYLDRRREVIQRLRLLLENDAVRSMLLAPQTRFRLADVLDQGKIIIINNNQGTLGKWGAEFFGRFFISQIWAAATSRKSGVGYPVYVFVDEAAIIIKRDERIADILDECRSKRFALCLAHQRLDQIESKNVLSALQNCAIRITNSDEDARSLADNFRTTPAFLQSLNVGQFAVFVRDVTRQHPFILNVRAVDFTGQNLMTEQDKAQLAQQIKEKYGIETQTAPKGTVNGAPRGNIPIAAHEGPSKPEPSTDTQSQTSQPPGRNARVPSVPQKDSDPSKPAPWVRG